MQMTETDQSAPNEANLRRFGAENEVGVETKPNFGRGEAVGARQCVRHRQAGAFRCHPGREPLSLGQGGRE